MNAIHTTTTMLSSGNLKNITNINNASTRQRWIRTWCTTKRNHSSIANMTTISHQKLRPQTRARMTKNSHKSRDGSYTQSYSWGCMTTFSARAEGMLEYTKSTNCSRIMGDHDWPWLLSVLWIYDYGKSNLAKSQTQSQSRSQIVYENVP
jgi:hypothetical protein